MIFLKSWLQDYIDLSKFSNQQIAERVTNYAMEVEEIIEIKDYFGGLVVLGQIEKPQSVEGSNKLKSFKVNLGDRHVNILSAAPNVEEGMIVPVALVGAKLPHGLAIAERKMMGQLSQGMCCGKSEMCLEEGYSAGLWDVGAELGLADKQDAINEYLGKSICEVFPWLFPTQTLIDIKVLPDKMGTSSNYLGMAFEIALAFQDLSLLTEKSRLLLDFETLAEKALSLIDDATNENLVEFHDKVDYNRFFTLFKAKIHGELYVPANVALRIFLIGQNSVSSMVDISNYLLQDIGQPTHFFSWDKVERKVNGTQARFTLDKLQDETEFAGLGLLKQVNLPVNTDVIRLNTEPVLIPGISGGQTTSVDKGEDEFLVEMATFRAEMVARNSFLIGYRSEAVRVFAGGVPASKLLVCIVALKEMLGEKISLKALWLSENNKVGTGNTTSYNLVELAQKIKDEIQAPMQIDLDYINDRWEDANHHNHIRHLLGLLGSVEPLDGANLVRFIPNRTVLNYPLAEDVLGDIARLHGLGEIVSVASPLAEHVNLDTVYKPWLLLKELVSNLGFTETINRPFISPEILDNLSVTQADSLLILNPIRSQEPYCRTGLIESLLMVTKRNLEAGFGDINLFESNKVYVPKSNHTEKEGVLISGSNVVEKNLLGLISTTIGTQDMAVVMNIIAKRMKQSFEKFEELNNDYTKNGFIADNGQVSVKIMQISNALKKKFGIPLGKNIVYLEFNLSHWDKEFEQFSSYREDREYPDVKRSMSLFVPGEIWFKQIKEVVIAVLAESKPDWEAEIKVSERLAKYNDEADVLNLDLRFNKADSTIDGKEVDALEEELIAALQLKLSPDIKRR